MSVPLGRQIALTSKVLKEYADIELARHGANLTTWIVLFHAAKAEPPGLSQKGLADDMAIGGPALVRHIDRLEAEGLVRRTRDRHDRRITRITVTTKGLGHLDQLRETMDRTDEQMRDELTPAEVRALERGLRKLHDYAIRKTLEQSETA